MRISRDTDVDSCPVSDDMLGELYRSSKNGLSELIATVSPAARAALALYCYRRGHLKSIGLVIASSCSLHDLETAGGAAGAALHARSRETAPTPPAPSQYVARQKISLATGTLRKSLPIDEDVDLDETEAAAETLATDDVATHGAAAESDEAANDDAPQMMAASADETPPEPQQST